MNAYATYLYVFMYAGVHVGTRGQPQDTAALFIETSHLISLGPADSARLAGGLAPRILSLQLSSTEIKIKCHCAHFFIFHMGSGEQVIILKHFTDWTISLALLPFCC